MQNQTPIACQLYDYIEIACMYNLHVMVTLKNDAVSLSWLSSEDKHGEKKPVKGPHTEKANAIDITGVAKTTKMLTTDMGKIECVALLPLSNVSQSDVSKSDVTADKEQKEMVMIALTDIVSLTAITKNPHFSVVHF
jgi:transcriptional antiterminator Rof (Rho-off)